MRVRGVHSDPVSREHVRGDARIPAVRVAMLGIAPITGLRLVAPKTDRGNVALETVRGDLVVLPMLDGDPHAIPHETVSRDFRLVAVPAPQSVVAALRAVPHERVATESSLHRVRGRKTEVVAEEEIVVRAARARVHRALSRPKEQAVAAVRRG